LLLELVENKDNKTALDLVNKDTHQLVKEYLERAALGTHIVSERLPFAAE